jgi:SAM-dependent methyltransferase
MTMDTPNFFDDGSPFLKHPLLTPQRTAQEVNFLVSQLELQPGARVLDVGCGFGRHTVEFARRGYAVVGIDPSPAMIAAARQRATEAGVAATLVAISGEAYKPRESFDAAICLFTTLGQMTEAGDNRALVPHVFSLLQADGFFVVETPQRDWAVQHLKAEERLGVGPRYADVQRHYDPESRAITEVFTVVAPQATRSYVLRYRLYDRDALVGMLEGAGFAVQAVFGDYQGSPLTPDSPAMLIIGRKALS